MRYRILVVDDQKMELSSCRDFLDRILKAAGHEAEVVGAINEEESLRAVKEYGFSLDLILLDLYLTGTKGTEIYAKIKDWCQKQRVPVYICSSFRGPGGSPTNTNNTMMNIAVFGLRILNKRDPIENEKVVLEALLERNQQTHMNPQERQEYWELAKKFGGKEKAEGTSGVYDMERLRFEELKAKWDGQQALAEKFHKRLKRLKAA